MAPRKDNTNSSPPGTPGSDEARFSPIPITWSPVTPYSQVRPGTARHTSNLRSPLEAPNDRRRNLGGVSQHDSGESSNEVNVAKVEQYYKEQYDGQIQKCIAAIRKLERENRTLSQSAGPDYLLQLEDTIQTLETSNSQLTSENKSLKLSEQSWRARSERLSVELAESGKDLLAANNKNIGGTKDKNSAETKELIKDLRAVREENTELYDKCISMQETIDKLEASGGDKAAMAAKLQLIQISEHTILTAAERSSMKVDLVELSDQMDQQIELRMLAKGSMFFDDGNASHGLEVNLLELEELKDTIRSQQDEIETLREAADDHFSTRPGPIKDGLPAPVSSLENEFRKRIEVLTQELETTRDQLVKQEAYASALKVFKDQISHPTTGNAFQNLNGKIHTMDQMILNLIAKIQELQRDFEARLLESSTGSDFAEAGDIAEKLHDVREGFGKMVLLSNDIQVINNEAKEELAVDVTHKQEVVEKPKIEIPPPKSILKTAAEKIETLPPKSTLKIAAEKIVEPMKLEQYKPTTTQETRLIKSEPKTFMERLWTNLNDGGKYFSTHHSPSPC